MTVGMTVGMTTHRLAEDQRRAGLPVTEFPRILADAQGGLINGGQDALHCPDNIGDLDGRLQELARPFGEQDKIGLRHEQHADAWASRPRGSRQRDSVRLARRESGARNQHLDSLGGMQRLECLQRVGEHGNFVASDLDGYRECQTKIRVIVDHHDASWHLQAPSQCGARNDSQAR